MRPCLREERALQPERAGDRLQKAGLVRGEQVAGEERGAARLRGSGELRGGSFLPRSPWCLHGASPIQSTAGVSRVLFRVGEAFPGEAERTHWTEVTRVRGLLLQSEVSPPRDIICPHPRCEPPQSNDSSSLLLLLLHPEHWPRA